MVMMVLMVLMVVLVGMSCPPALAVKVDKTRIKEYSVNLE